MQLMSLKCHNGILDHVVLIFALFTLSFFYLVVYLLPFEVYGSTLPCDPSNLTICDEKTSSASSNTAAGDNTQSDNAGTPLVLPDISPTAKDLGNPTTNTDPDTSDTDSVNNNNDDDNSGNSADNDDDTNIDNEEENGEDSGNSDDESSGGSDDGHSLIPFP